MKLIKANEFDVEQALRDSEGRVCVSVEAPSPRTYKKLKVKCEVCEVELPEPGALVLSPPDSKGRTTKWHVCSLCFASGFCITDRGKFVPDVPWGEEE
jgi:hypothetical protein